LLDGVPYVDESFPYETEAIYWNDRRPEKANHSLIEVAENVLFW